LARAIRHVGAYHFEGVDSVAGAGEVVKERVRGDLWKDEIVAGQEARESTRG
jgi:hypothetical protein